MDLYDNNHIEKWMNGGCIPFAVALNEIFPQYCVAVLMDEHEVDDEDIECNTDLVHAFCYHPNNPDIIIDARGVGSLDDLEEHFFDINPIIEWDIPDTKHLIDNFAGKEFFLSESYEYDPKEYQEAKEWIKNNIESYDANKAQKNVVE